MKLTVISDLHLDHRPPEQIRGLIDTLSGQSTSALVIAGDICEHSEEGFEIKVNFLKEMSKRFPKVFYVNGNHDYWGLKNPEEVERDLLNEFKRPDDFDQMRGDDSFENVRLLSDGYSEEYMGYKFLGGTMWYDANSSSWCDSRFTPNLPMYKYDSIKRFQQNLDKELDDKTIVITHMLPSDKSIHPDFQHSLTNCFFVKDQEQLIKERKPTLWIHGHTHYPFNYMLGKTQIYCNPMAYYKEGTNPRFYSRLKVRILPL